MTDIFIKSFNRPYYLERCLSSIYQMVSGDFSVTVLDDGTPEKYLEVIRRKFPNARIVKSENHTQKTLAIEENLKTGAPINGFSIPVNLWITAAKSASDYFIMTEDDVWFTEKINLDKLTSDCKKFDIQLLKLGWLGNFTDDKNLNINKLNSEINSAQPKNLILLDKKWMEAFFYNRFKFFTILYKLGKVDNFTQRKYWALNSILMGLYKKEYWLKIWEDMNGKVDEKRQLVNASAYYRKHQKNENFISRLNQEAMKTTFQSSATGSYHEYGFNFDVNMFNHILNEAWLSGALDAAENYPKDFSTNYIEKYIDQKMDIQEYRKWVEKFKNQYKNLGCDVS